MKWLFFFFSFLLLQLIAVGQPEQGFTHILLKNATIIDCISDEDRQGDILIKDGIISEIDYTNSIDPPKGAVTYDLTDHFIIPGLIDAHVHFGTNPSGSDNLEATKIKLDYLFNHGITSIRDMAGDTRYLSFLARSAQLNEISSPDIYYSSLMAGQTFFDDPRTHASAKGAIPGQAAWMKAVDKRTNMSLAIAEAKGTGATGIKIYADLNKDVIQLITKEAHLQGLKVWAHAAVFPAKPQAIVDAQVDVISHATLLAWEGVDYLPNSAKGRYVKQDNFDINAKVFDELFNSMKDNGTILDATVAVYKSPRREESIFNQGIALTKKAYQMGVQIGIGTDNMNIGELPETTPILREMHMMVEEVGMTPIDVLKAATMINAKIIGKQDQIGSIEKGKQAHLVVLRANPLIDIMNLSKVTHVMKGKEMSKIH